MTTVNLIQSGAYTLDASVTPVQRPDGHYRLHITSRFAAARNPDEPRTLLDVLLDGRAANRLAVALPERAVTTATTGE